MKLVQQVMNEKILASKRRFKNSEAISNESKNIQKLISDEFLKLGVKKQSISRISTLIENLNKTEAVRPQSSCLVRPKQTYKKSTSSSN